MQETLSRLVCYVDFSAGSAGALATALALARTHDAQVDILHTLTPDELSSTGPETDDQDAHAVERSESRLGTLVSQLGSDKVKTRFVVERGNAARALAAHVSRDAPNLVVIGRNVRSHRKLLGLEVIATEEVRRAECPTLLVNRESSDSLGDAPFGFKEIVCAVDLSPGWKAVVAHACRLADPAGGRVTVLHVLDQYPRHTVHSASRALRLMEDYPAVVQSISRQLRNGIPEDLPPSIDVATRVATGSPQRAMLETGAELGTDLIVLGIRPESIVDRILFGSTTRTVIRKATSALLIVPMPPEESSDLGSS